jgi:iron complex outermembrane receptor protein
LFAYEEYKTGWGKLTFGGRLESVKVESLGNPNPTLAKFVPGQRNFRPSSYALGSLWNLTPQWQLTGNAAYTERAPKDYELFANGPHIATRAYEVGNSTFAKEQATQLDVGVAWKSAFDSFALNAYTSNFKNYIGLVQSAGVIEAESQLNEFRYQQTRARFTGFEASGNIRLIEGAAPIDLALRADVVKATNSSTGQPLSRIPPLRLGATLKYASGPFGANIGLDHSAAQKSVPAGDRAAAANTRLNAGASYRVKAGPVNTLLYARLDNITNALAYSPTSILTSTAFPNAPPLPGRNLKVGLQASF